MTTLIVRPGALGKLDNLLPRPADLLIVDEAIPKQYLNQVRPHAQSQLLVPQGEACKSPELAELCWAAMGPFGRGALILSLGGGAVSDLAGFAAATYMRGVDVIHLPTTLLAMVDASLGGKTAINFAGRKNLVGAFHMPLMVIADPLALQTLPKRSMVSGMAEVIKYGIVLDPDLLHLNFSVSSLIERCAALKNKVVEDDPRDEGGRWILNFGHTIGHALEALLLIPHGEAVAMGMVAEARLAESLGFSSVVEPLIAACDLAGLPIEIPSGIDVDALIQLMHADKKGPLAFALPTELGKMELVTGVDESLVLQVVTEYSIVTKNE